MAIACFSGMYGQDHSEFLISSDGLSVNLAESDLGGVVTVWMIENDTTYQSTLRAQSIDHSGTSRWNTSGVPVFDSTFLQSPRFSAVGDGRGGAIVAFYGMVEGGDTNSNQLFIQRLDRNGMGMWGEDGIQLFVDTFVTTSAGVSKPSLLPDGAGGAFVTWHFLQEPAMNISVARVDSNGNVVWTSSLSPISYEFTDPSICTDDSGGLYLCYRLVPGRRKVAAQHLDSEGRFLWPDTGIVLGDCDGPGPFPPFDLTRDGTGGMIISWIDYADNGSLRVQRIAANGTLLWQDGGIVIGKARNDVKLTASANGDVVVIWATDDSTRAQRISPSGQLLWGTAGRLIFNGDQEVIKTAVGEISNSKTVLAWCSRNSNVSGGNLYISGLDQEGDSWIPVTLLDSIRRLSQFPPELHSDANRAFLVWSTNPGIVLSIVDTTGIVSADIQEDQHAPYEFALYCNYPNPFNPTTMIRYSVPGGFVTLSVFDVLGRHMITLVPRSEHNAGIYEASFSPNNFPSGVYFARLSVTDANHQLLWHATRKLLFTK
jgi:hypothetical protein